jgi:hypothetical protein
MADIKQHSMLSHCTTAKQPEMYLKTQFEPRSAAIRLSFRSH